MVSPSLKRYHHMGGISSETQKKKSSRICIDKLVYQNPNIYILQQDVCICQGGGCPRCWKN